jgi:hypothetical protein
MPFRPLLTWVFLAGKSQMGACAVAARRGRQLALYQWRGLSAGELKGSLAQPGNWGDS